MKAPKESTVYISQDVYQGEAGTSNIANIPMNTPIVYGENPNLTVNEYGQTVVNQDIPTPLNNTTPKEQAQQDADESNANTPKNVKEPKKDFGTIIKDVKAVQKAKTMPTPVKPTTNYLLYGAIGLGAVVILLGIFKKD